MIISENALLFSYALWLIGRFDFGLDTRALRRHGITLRSDRLDDPARDVTDALNDPRPLHAQPHGDVRRTARDLHHTLAHLERWLARAT